MDSSSFSSNEEKRPKLIWSRNVEKLLSMWADLASCHKWMHEKSYRKFKTLNYYYSIPIIVLTTITGTISVGMTSLFPANAQQFAQIIVGSVNIVTGIITTLQNFFRYAQLSESHLNAFSGWSRLHRNIMIELNLERKSRKDASDFVKICRSEYDRLMEQQPLYPPEVVQEFKKKFGDIKDLFIPDIADNIKHTYPVDDSPKTPKKGEKMNTLKQKLLEKIKEKPEDKNNFITENIDRTINLQKLNELSQVNIDTNIDNHIKNVMKNTENTIKPRKVIQSVKNNIRDVVSANNPVKRSDVIENASEIKINVQDLIKRMEKDKEETQTKLTNAKSNITSQLKKKIENQDGKKAFEQFINSRVGNLSQVVDSQKSQGKSQLVEMRDMSENVQNVAENYIGSLVKDVENVLENNQEKEKQEN